MRVIFITSNDFRVLLRVMLVIAVIVLVLGIGIGLLIAHFL
jgi:hypothetical protein